LEVEESEHYFEESVCAPDSAEGFHVNVEGSFVGEEESEGFEGFEAELDIHDEFGDGFYDNWEEWTTDEIADLGCMNMKEITVEEIKSLHFSDQKVTFLFYNLYTKMNSTTKPSTITRKACGKCSDKRNLSSFMKNAFMCLHVKGTFVYIHSIFKYLHVIPVWNFPREWRISHYQNGPFFKCSCMRIETFGILCDHIIVVLVHLDIIEIPASVVLERWSKDARSRVRAFMEKRAILLGSDGKTLSPTGEGVDHPVSSTLEDGIKDPQVVHHCKQRKIGIGTQGRAQKAIYEETNDNEYKNIMEELKTHWSGQNASEKDEDDSFDKDHYLD
ncbi:hypothetical protein S245_001900, partial [Arachis hypogaea]